MLESIDRLRIFAQSEFLPGDTAYEVIHLYADEIEAEIAERFMKLPVDADGVPIRVGDVVTVVTAHGFLPVGGIGSGRVWFMYDGVANFDLYENVRHVKPRTLEDVLSELVSDARDDMRRDFSVAAYAAEIRELLGVEE